MATKLEQTDTNLFSNFNAIINEIGNLQSLQKQELENLSNQADSLLLLLNTDISVIQGRIKTIETVILRQQTAFNQNVLSRASMTTVENLIPQRLADWQTQSTESARLSGIASQYVPGVTVLEYSPLLAELVTLGKQIGKVVAVNTAGRLEYIDSPSGIDRSGCSHFAHRQPSGTNGMFLPPTNWLAIPLNTTLKTERGVGISGGNLILPAGTYTIIGYGIAANSGGFRCRLRNSGTNEEVMRGNNSTSTRVADVFNAYSYFHGSFSTNGASFVVEIQSDIGGSIGLATSFPNIQESYLDVVVIRW